MKKITALFLVCILMMTMFCGCGNMQLLDMTYTFNYAIISLPNGDVVEGKVTSWRDFEDGDQIQLVIDDVTYLVHSSNVAMMNK